jgi:hypothetical protein
MGRKLQRCGVGEVRGRERVFKAAASSQVQKLEIGQPDRQGGQGLPIFRRHFVTNAQLLQGGGIGERGLEVDSGLKGGKIEVGQLMHGHRHLRGEVVQEYQPQLQALEGGQG